MDDLHAAKVRGIKYQSINISAFKIYVPKIQGRLSEGEESTTLFTEIWTPEFVEWS